jgi:hypothetical protein
MQRTRAPRIASVVALLLLASCIGSYEQAVEETRAGLIGKTGRELRECLGVPTDFDRAGDVELLTYRWVYNPKSGRDLPIGSGGIGGIVIGRNGAGGGGDPLGFPRDLDEEAFCQLDFELGKSGVTKVTALGRDEVGLRTNAECMMRARRCVDEDDGD